MAKEIEAGNKRLLKKTEKLNKKNGKSTITTHSHDHRRTQTLKYSMIDKKIYDQRSNNFFSICIICIILKIQFYSNDDNHEVASPQQD